MSRTAQIFRWCLMALVALALYWLSTKIPVDFFDQSANQAQT